MTRRTVSRNTAKDPVLQESSADFDSVDLEMENVDHSFFPRSRGGSTSGAAHSVSKHGYAHGVIGEEDEEQPQLADADAAPTTQFVPVMEPPAPGRHSRSSSKVVGGGSDSDDDPGMATLSMWAPGTAAAALAMDDDPGQLSPMSGASSKRSSSMGMGVGPSGGNFVFDSPSRSASAKAPLSRRVSKEDNDRLLAAAAASIGLEPVGMAEVPLGAPPSYEEVMAEEAAAADALPADVVEILAATSRRAVSDSGTNQAPDAAAVAAMVSALGLGSSPSPPSTGGLFRSPHVSSALRSPRMSNVSVENLPPPPSYEEALECESVSNRDPGEDPTMLMEELIMELPPHVLRFTKSASASPSSSAKESPWKSEGPSGPGAAGTAAKSAAGPRTSFASLPAVEAVVKALEAATGHPDAVGIVGSDGVERGPLSPSNQRGGSAHDKLAQMWGPCESDLSIKSRITYDTASSSGT